MPLALLFPSIAFEASPGFRKAFLNGDMTMLFIYMILSPMTVLLCAWVISMFESAETALEPVSVSLSE